MYRKKLYDFIWLQGKGSYECTPPVECSSSSLFNDFSYAPQYHSLSHNNVCWLQYSLAVWDCVNCFMIPDLQWYSQRKNTMVAEFPASRISGNNSPSIHFTAWKGNFLITTCASWAILATSWKKWPPIERLERNTVLLLVKIMSKVGKVDRFKTRALTWDIYTESLIFAKTNKANENFSIWAKNISAKTKELISGRIRY